MTQQFIKKIKKWRSETNKMKAKPKSHISRKIKNKIMKTLLRIIILIGMSNFVACSGQNAKEKANMESISNDIIGYWHDYHRYSNNHIKISKTGESFLIEVAAYGDVFEDGQIGIYTLTKEGNLTSGSDLGSTTIAYDKTSQKLLVRGGQWEKDK